LTAQRERAATAARRALALACSVVAAGCAGLFQEAMPDTAAAFHRVATGELRVGAAEADITPDDEQYLAGFDLARRSEGVHSALKARAFVVSVGEESVAIVGVDNLGLQRHDADWIKASIAGIPNGCVFLCSSHTHAAPDLVGLWGFYLLTTGRDHAYLMKVRDGVCAAVAAAQAGARPARLVRGEAALAADGPVRNSNRPGVFDRRVTVLHAVDVESGAPLGTLLHLACHPEVMRRGNTLVSADFVGALCDGWRASGRGQAVFVNGALGAMVSPRPDGEEGVTGMGASLVELAHGALERAKPVEVRDLEVRRRDVYLPMQTFGLSLARLTMVVPRPLHRGCARTTVGYLRLGEFEACTVPGEGEPGWAQRIAAASHRPDLLVFGLTDDEVGYLLSDRDAHDPEFAYERSMSPGPLAGEIVLGALVGSPVTANPARP
jgi:hypothetical protein